MKSTNNILMKLSVTMFLFVSVQLVSSFAVAFPTMKWCTTWKTEYEDAGYGEDHFASTSRMSRPAAYTVYKLVDLTHNQAIYSGVLDSDGCTHDIGVIANTSYKFIQYAHVVRADRQIKILADSSVAEQPPWTSNTTKSFNNYYVTGNLSDTQYTYTFTPYNTYLGNIMAIAGRIVQNYSTYGMRPGNTIRIHTDAVNCRLGGGGGAYAYRNNVCLAPGEWDDPSDYKYIVGHEIGHSVLWEVVQEVPTNGMYDFNASSSQTRCLCNHVSTGVKSHCLGSRELIEAAIYEGHGHFFATMLFNNRTEDNGTYVYPKEAWDWIDGQWDTDSPPVKWKAYRSNNSEQVTDRWMEKNCNPGTEDRGVEADWLRFNYELWTTGSDNYSSTDIMSVSDRTYNTYGGWKWNYHKQAATDFASQGVFSQDKADLYREKGEEMGVDHFSNPRQ